MAFTKFFAYQLLARRTLREYRAYVGLRLAYGKDRGRVWYIIKKIYQRTDGTNSSG